MPRVGGRELAEVVRGLRQETRILFMSGYTDDVVLEHGIAQGSAAFIDKPFTLPSLLAKVRQTLAE